MAREVVTKKTLIRWFVRLNLRHFGGKLTMPDLRIGDIESRQYKYSNGHFTLTIGHCSRNEGDDYICIDGGFLRHPEMCSSGDAFEVMFHEILHWYHGDSKTENEVLALTHLAHNK